MNRVHQKLRKRSSVWWGLEFQASVKRVDGAEIKASEVLKSSVAKAKRADYLERSFRVKYRGLACWEAGCISIWRR